MYIRTIDASGKMTVCCRCNSNGRCKNCSCSKGGTKCVNCLPSRKSRCVNSAPATATVTTTGPTTGPTAGPLTNVVGSLEASEASDTSCTIGSNYTSSFSRNGGDASSDNELHGRNALTIARTLSNATLPLDNEPRSRNSAFDIQYCSHTSPLVVHDGDTCRKCKQLVSVQHRVSCAGVCEGSYHLDCIDATSTTSVWFCLQCAILQGKRVRVLRHIPKGARISGSGTCYRRLCIPTIIYCFMATASSIFNCCSSGASS